LIRAELNDNNVITHIDTNPASTVITAGLTSGQIRTQLGNDSDMRQLVNHLQSLTPTSKLITGDVNFDGFVNGADTVSVFGNFGATGRKWSDGDVASFDGVVNGNDVVGVFGNFGQGPAPLRPGSGGAGASTDGGSTDGGSTDGGSGNAGNPAVADLIYDPSTGSVTMSPIEAALGKIVAFSLQSNGAFNVTGSNGVNVSSSILPNGRARTSNGISAASGTPDLDNLLDPVPTTLGLSTDHVFAGLLPINLTLAQFQALFTNATYAGGFTAQGLGTGAFTFDFVLVPEPMSLTLVMGATSMLLRRRRRAA